MRDRGNQLDRLSSATEINIKKILEEERAEMLWTIVVILVVLWLLGLIGGIGGGLIHLLLVLALVVIVINLLQGRRAV